MEKVINKKIIAIFMLLITLISNIIPITESLAVNNHNIGDEISITSIGKVDYHLRNRS